MPPRSLLLLAVLLLGCGVRRPGDTGDVVNPVEVTVTMDRSTYAPGETIIAALVVHNRSDTILTLSFTSGQRYDFAVQDAAGTVHWRWGAERGFIQALGEETLGPQDTLRYTERIDAPRARGRYTLVGTVTARDHVGRASATFLVE